MIYHKQIQLSLWNVLPVEERPKDLKDSIRPLGGKDRKKQ